MLTNISSYTHSTKHLTVTCELFSQSSFLKGISLHWPTLTTVVIQSGLSYCQVFNSAYVLYILFFAHIFYKFQHFHVFIVDRWPMQTAHLLFTSRCFVVLRVSVLYIANCLLFVWTCVRNHNLAACHFHNILYNWYISIICLDLCQKSQSGVLVSKPKLLCFWSFYVPYVSANPLDKYYTTWYSTCLKNVLIHSNVCINNLSEIFWQDLC